MSASAASTSAGGASRGTTGIKPDTPASCDEAHPIDHPETAASAAAANVVTVFFMPPAYFSAAPSVPPPVQCAR